MNIERGAAGAVLQRRELVHPFTVVAIVVSAVRRVVPALLVQEALNAAEFSARHQHIDIRQQATPRARQICREVGRAFEQSPRDVGGIKHPAQTIDLPACAALVRAGHAMVRPQMTAHRGGHLRQQRQGLQLGVPPSGNGVHAAQCQQVLPGALVVLGEQGGLAQRQQKLFAQGIPPFQLATARRGRQSSCATAARGQSRSDGVAQGNHCCPPRHLAWRKKTPNPLLTLWSCANG